MIVNLYLLTRNQSLTAQYAVTQLGSQINDVQKQIGNLIKVHNEHHSP